MASPGASDDAGTARFELADRASVVGIWDWDPRSDTFAYSDSARAICGLPAGSEPLHLDDIVRVTHPDDLPRTSAMAKRALDPAIRERVSYEYRIVRPDGEVRWVVAHGEALFGEVDGRVQAVRYAGTIQDITENRRLREALADSESRLRLAVEGGRLAVLEMDLRSDSLTGSPELYRLFGFAEGVQPSLDEIRAGYPPGERERLAAVAQEQLARGERFIEAEFRYGGPSRELRWLLLRAEVHADQNGPTKAVGVLIDITGRHRVEDALRASETRLKLAQRAANTGVWEWDAATGEVSWSPEVYHLLGLDPVADAADPHAAWMEILHPDDRAFVDATGPRAVHDGHGFTFDFRIIRRGTGEVRWIRSHGTVVAGDDGRPTRVVGVNLDVTDEHRQQQALEERNRTLQQTADQSLRERERVFELSQDLFAAVGFDGFLKVINPAWGRLLGYPEATLLGRPLAALVHPDDLAAGARVGLAMLRGKPTHRFENRLRCADGSWRRFSWVVTCEGPTIYAVGRDVTEETRIAEALETANRQLLGQIQERERVEDTLRQVQRLEAVGQLTAGVSHDFNNLLTVILGNIEMVERATTDPRLQQRLGFMRQAALRGATLTAQLLAFSRRQRLQPKPVDLNSTVEGMSELLKSTMGGSVRLSTVLKPDPWSALVDPTQIEMMILNLAINARDAMPVGGSLTIEAANVTLIEPPQRPGEPGPGDYVMIRVSDTGTGMDEAVRARAFEPFFTTKEVGKGSGLGLAQVLGFAQQSGGGVRIDSRPGEGTAVSVYLPRVLTEAEADQASLFADVRMPLAVTCLALVVDDDRDVREVTSAKLREMGLRVIDTGTGVAALDLLERNPEVGLLVADFAMPGMSGAEVAMRARLRRPGLPVIFVTGYADQSALAEVPDAVVVQKPYRQDELERQVAALVFGADGVVRK